MPTSSVIFDPEIDKRKLDKEAQDVEATFSDAASDLQADFDAEFGGGGALRPDDAGGGMGGAGQAAGIGAIASKIPKPVAGVSAAAALPVALAGGGIGIGMLRAMQSASGHLQTDARLMSIAVDNFFREPGNILSENVTRPLAEEFLNTALEFDEALRNLDLVGALSEVTIGIGTGDEGVFERLGSLLGSAGGGLAGVKAGMTAGAAAGSVIPGAGTAAGGLVGAGLGGLMGVIFGGRVGGGLGFDFGQWWESNISIPDWPGWPDVKGLWPEWPKIKNLWPGWPDVKVDWPGWPNVKLEWANMGGWPDIGVPEWPSASDILDGFPSISPGDLIDEITGGGDGGETDTELPPGRFNPTTQDDGGGGFWDNILTGTNVPGLQSGGRVTGSGVARVHRGELVADPDRLVSELASAVDSATPNRSASGDLSRVEAKLDELNRNLSRVANRPVNVQVGRETIARVSESGRRDRLTDVDPTV